MFIYFLFIVLIMYIPVTIYVGLKLFELILYFFSPISKIGYWVIFIILSSLFVLSRIVSKGLPYAISEALIIIGYYWLIAIFYFFGFFLVLDFVRIISKFFNISLPLKPFVPGLITVILVISLLIYGTWNSFNPRVTNYDLTIAKDGGTLKELKVVMVSDIHLSSIVNNNRLQEMVYKINDLDPDLILIPGDIIEDAEVFAKQNMMETFSKLKARFGTFISLGNHEYYGGRIKETVESLEQIGFFILKDNYVKVADSFYVVGREDTAANRLGMRRKDLKEVLLEIDKNLPIILLNHQPIDLEEALNEGIDLQVSGHTHRGQIFPANLITSRIFEKDWGYLQKHNLQLIVTSGYGTWGPPLRIGNIPEIVEITISFKE